ncbi:hypothetical protein [Pedobacter nototheniae]|uniref:hypothetical protein n=1 Tax=Pedobacter nototheniae TaxID=2488994 RepID=UPI0029318BDE|nr:hypothetical protein [Pedobacter nototheniae]
MKKYVLLLTTLCVLFFACSKTNKNDPAAIDPSKKIDRILISPEYLLQLKSIDLYIGIRYFKDYTDKDEVTVTLNNTKGVVTSETVGTVDGTNLLFRIPGITQAGDYKVKCVVKNNQNSLEKELTLRVVNDFSLNTVWNSLDKNYASSFSSYADRLKQTSTYLLRSITNTDTQIQFGSYIENFDNTNLNVGKSFIAALPGKYSLTYNNQNLQEIKIINGEPNQNANFIVSKFYTDLTTAYGNYTSQTNNGSGKITLYKSGSYTITVTESASLISTVITKI